MICPYTRREYLERTPFFPTRHPERKPRDLDEGYGNGVKTLYTVVAHINALLLSIRERFLRSARLRRASVEMTVGCGRLQPRFGRNDGGAVDYNRA